LPSCRQDKESRSDEADLGLKRAMTTIVNNAIADSMFAGLEGETRLARIDR
jgi:hypothetical protein